MERSTRSVWLGSLDVTATIDRRPLSALGLRVAILCGIAVLLDGYDVQVISFVAPVLTQALGVSRSMLGPVFSMGLVGTTLGALILGPLADRIGRKTVLLGCILAFALSSLGTMTASGIGSLMMWRLLSGVALGGTTPVAVALTAEFCPARVRGTATIIVCCGVPVGAGGGAFIVAQLIPAFGWSSAFLLGGLPPLALLVAAMFLLPESIGDLARRDRADLVATTLKRIAPDVFVDPTAEVRLGQRERVSGREAVRRRPDAAHDRALDHVLHQHPVVVFHGVPALEARPRIRAGTAGRLARRSAQPLPCAGLRPSLTSAARAASAWAATRLFGIQRSGLARLDDMLRAANGVRRVGGDDLAGDQPVEQLHRAVTRPPCDAAVCRRDEPCGR